MQRRGPILAQAAKTSVVVSGLSSGPPSTSSLPRLPRSGSRESKPSHASPLNNKPPKQRAESSGSEPGGPHSVLSPSLAG